MNVTVYLPRDLGQRAKDEGLPLSRMLRAAVIEEFDRRARVEQRVVAFLEVQANVAAVCSPSGTAP